MKKEFVKPEISARKIFADDVIMLSSNVARAVFHENVIKDTLETPENDIYTGSDAWN